jgi:hypothetical protein
VLSPKRCTPTKEQRGCKHASEEACAASTFTRWHDALAPPVIPIGASPETGPGDSSRSARHDKGPQLGSLCGLSQRDVLAAQPTCSINAQPCDQFRCSTWGRWLARSSVCGHEGHHPTRLHIPAASPTLRQCTASHLPHRPRSASCVSINVGFGSIAQCGRVCTAGRWRSRRRSCCGDRMRRATC